MLLLAACSSPEPLEVEDKPVRPHPLHAQSDFLDVGELAGIEWLSFVPDDQRTYPELFEGLDPDQKDRLRLAPRESNERVLLHFDLPERSKLWPVDWYGTELMAIDLPDYPGFSVALAEIPEEAESVKDTPADLFYWRFSIGIGMEDYGALSLDLPHWVEGDVYIAGYKEGRDWLYAARVIEGHASSLLLVLEAKPHESDRVSAAQYRGAVNILSGISIKRELALEGSPKHKVRSSLDELLGGTLHFPEGTLKLPIRDGYLVRKIGGDSTIQIDGEGAAPWVLIRRLDETELEGDLRVRVRNDTTFKRRLGLPGADFGRGKSPGNAELPIVTWSYADSSARQQLLGIMKTGDEILTFEVVSNGLRDGDERRAARDAALAMLADATGEPAAEAPEFTPLVGWNVQTMGREE